MLPALLAALALQPDPAMLRRLFEEALERRKQQYGAADARTAQAARDLGTFLARQENTADARTALAEAVRIDEAAGAGEVQILADVAELAAVAPLAEAEPLWRRASRSPEAATASRALAALGQLHAAAGDRTGAASFYRNALAKEEAASGKESAGVAMRLNALAQAVGPGAGIPLLQRALAIDKRALGARHPETASTEANLAGMLMNLGRNDEAIRAASDALAVFQETLGADHPRVAIAASILAFALEGKGERSKAEKMFRLAVAIDERAYGPRHPQTLQDRQTLAEFLKRR